MFTKARNYIDKLTKEKELPLLNVIAYKNHEQLFSHSASYNNAHGKGEPLCMFSCTKVLCAVSGMKLIEEGKISLDDPVAKYIPAFEEAFTLDEKGNKHKEVITVRHLFSMSSGLDYNRSTPEIERLRREKYKTADTADVVCEFIKRPLNFSPGEKFMYSLSHDVLGAVIETVEGTTLADCMQKQIFTPLGMKNSTMRSKEYIDSPPTSYKILEDNSFEVENGDTYRSFHMSENYVSGGAGLISTAEDLAIFADTLASGGTAKNGYRLINLQTIEKMKEIQFGSLNVKNNYTCVQGKDYAYGLGVRVRTEPLLCGIPAGEFGWDGAAGSYILIDTDNGISITMGMNILNWPKVFSGEHLEIAKRIYEDLI